MAWIVLPLALVVLAFAISLRRATEMFVISVRRGKTLVMRGRIPITLKQEIGEVMCRAGVAQAELRVVRSGGAAKMIADGVDPIVAQRLRNVLGLYPDYKLRAAPPPGRRNLGQRLGIPWLAWRLQSKR